MSASLLQSIMPNRFAQVTITFHEAHFHQNLLNYKTLSLPFAPPSKSVIHPSMSHKVITPDIIRAFDQKFLSPHNLHL